MNGHVGQKCFGTQRSTAKKRYGSPIVKLARDVGLSFVYVLLYYYSANAYKLRTVANVLLCEFLATVTAILF